MLEQVVALLEGRAELAQWPEPLRAALALALEDPSMSRSENWKAVTLRRHLFGPHDVIPAAFAVSPGATLANQMLAERLRSSVPACVRYRAGMYLLQAAG
jgi:hypothetical protein